MKNLQMKLGERSYPIDISSGGLAELGSRIKEILPESRKILIATDKNVNKIYSSDIENVLTDCGFSVEKKVVEAGEKSKSIKIASAFYDFMLNNKFERSSVVVGLGGGVVGDLAGFVASTYMRGIKFVQVPTSLLAQVDSSIGGKVAVNHPEAKNVIGAFYQPEYVMIDVETLKTLPDREFKGGLAEIIKHGYGFDPAFFEFLSENKNAIKNKEEKPLKEMIYRSCLIKKRVVQRDERETGERAKLNLGHTVAHALEAAGEFSGLNHGEAVAVGMVAESILAEKEGLIYRRNRDELIDLLKSYSLPISVPEEIDISSLIAAMSKDKKIYHGRVNFSLPAGTGQTKIYRNWSKENLIDALEKTKKID
ncbi:3-dehydroquinate synthase [Halarsenatibacter silvermanii]|uniref:3-dehydroquinate synthase n=1 Tax=Halarsenatibacter silvermanii TaxID=321763 RepID=A0A1G9P5K4_9FIRM|nr:3-dehydroquinate synthase [Halarsenatibacter silvermanii]SDL93813.1 3-dehydroquinate synthase [Halarsenatibacter silvermanii]